MSEKTTKGKKNQAVFKRYSCYMCDQEFALPSAAIDHVTNFHKVGQEPGMFVVDKTDPMTRAIKEESFTENSERTADQELMESRRDDTILATTSSIFPHLQVNGVKKEQPEVPAASSASKGEAVKPTQFNLAKVKKEKEDETKNGEMANGAQHMIKKKLPRDVDPIVYKKSNEDPGNISYLVVGGLAEQIRELREVVELPLINPELIRRVGITPPKGCLLFGPPGNGKTLLASAVASQFDCFVVKVMPSTFNNKTTGETAMLIREIFNYARDHQPCILFMDEIDAIVGLRLGPSADRERGTLVEMLNQLDGIDPLGKVKVIMATNRPDTLDPSLLRSGRLDRKIEIGLPNEQSRLEILKIHSNKITKRGEIDFEAVVKLSDGFSAADLTNVCTEAGLLAIRAEREFVIDEDFKKAARKVGDAKRLGTKLD
ncbi:hypothetical protein GCK72_007734 [Caenorhabditis remanei]|uniref:C2H2-type domain-containing protein n=1 Tax=Caenorhabditis remanei TaxID=31234 RepID=A0A6A5HJU9_CAERE|nr:hypothetical protein GCK72_007734 [Caenorhabditis remanei]KAF1767775.1 hypothetical protein GCK72_007734 [Caenorhabditis remanei]